MKISEISKNPVYSMESKEYNDKLAAALMELEEFKMPEWAMFVRTGVSKMRVPSDGDYWYKRAASILRQIYINKIVGVNRLRTRYGGRAKRTRGFKPERFKRGSGKIIRVILQQGEAAGFLEKAKEKRSGRRLTEKGKEFLENIKFDSENKAKTSKTETDNINLNKASKKEAKLKQAKQEVEADLDININENSEETE